MKELKIGEEIRIRCVDCPSNSCDGCVFLNAECHNIEFASCTAASRTDHKNVHFEIVEDNDCPTDETKAIVIDKACEWLEKQEGALVLLKADTIDEFHKAMTEL